MKVAVVVFPGSSGADDAVYAYREVIGADAYTVWHQQESLNKPDVVVLPGGAAFGDYLRPGALTLGSPIVGALRKFARDGGPMLGIGNGFQILCELKILPGVLLQNSGLKFLSRDVFLSVENIRTPFTKYYREEEVISLPIACSYGCYYVDKRTLKDIEENGNVVVRFCDREGEVDEKDPFNGSINSIAGVSSRHDNVVGLICHPERAVEPSIGGTSGIKLLESVFK